MSRVLFLQPPSPPRRNVSRDWAGGFGTASPVERSGYGHGPFSLPYVSLMYSAGIMLQREWDVSYVDAQAERLDARSTLARVGQSKPDVIVSVVSLPSVYDDGNLLRWLKSRLPSAKMIGIGTTCRVLPDVLAGTKAFDFLVLGEPEAVLPNLLQSIRDDDTMKTIPGIGLIRNGALSKTAVSQDVVSLESLPWPPYDVMPTSLYRLSSFKTRTLPVWASRGCPMPCSFYCPYPIGMGKSLRLRPIEDFVKEICYLNSKFAVSAFVFRDQIFSSNADRAEEICELLIAEKLRIRWLCETRLDMVNERLLKKLRKAGCRKVHFGLETGDPGHLRRIGKPGMRLSTVKRAIRLTKDAGISPMAHIIVGLPGETQETILRTLITIRELGLTRLNVNPATPYPGTPLHHLAKEEGLLETEDWSQYTSYNTVMRTQAMTAHELESARRYLARNFLGSTPMERISYLCKNKGIIEAISGQLQARSSPSLLFSLLRDQLVDEETYERRN